MKGTGRGRPGNARPGFPKGQNPCYLHDRFGPRSVGSSDNGGAARDMGLKAGDADAMTATVRTECEGY